MDDSLSHLPQEVKIITKRYMVLTAIVAVPLPTQNRRRRSTGRISEARFWDDFFKSNVRINIVRNQKPNIK